MSAVQSLPADWRCGCGSRDLIAVAPGAEGDDFGDLFAVARPVPSRCWCRPCWAARFGMRAAAPVSA